MKHMIKFCDKLEDNVTEIFNNLTQAYKHEVLSQAQDLGSTSHFWIGERLFKDESKVLQYFGTYLFVQHISQD